MTALVAELRLSKHTVKNHLSKIYDELGVSNRMEAVLFAMTPPTSRPSRNVGVPLGFLPEPPAEQQPKWEEA